MAASRRGNMAFSQDLEEDGVTMLDVVWAQLREKVVLKQLIVIARCKQDVSDKDELGAHYENMIFQLSRQHKWDHITGLLLIYPFYMLHIIEAPSDIVMFILKHLKVEQQPEGLVGFCWESVAAGSISHAAVLRFSASSDAKIAFVTHKLQSRLFQQWSYKVVNACHAVAGKADREEATEVLVCDVLSSLQKLGAQLESQKKVLPGSVLDKNPHLIVPQRVLEKLLGREELLTPEQYLLMYKSPLNINIDFGETMSRSFLSTI